ncbi:MAG: RdgB/HAM1 family non-canonical purine NTP pyrophosphatase [Clostridiales bacterium]|nr:RdgB/HAM1 family non-canonical purine NTP pyrophosphatase [Clostridiales bacterium]
MMRIVIATGNNDKVREINEILEGTEFEAVSMKSLGIDPDIVEDADSFRGNALKKAMAVHECTGDIVMADDSGLCIDALDGAPGIYSSRFCGEDSTYEEKFKKIFEMLKDVPEEKRTAHFTCAIAVVYPDGSSFTVEEIFEGVLHEEPKGENGFGYDPIFYVPEYGMTSAEMSPAMKHSMSHRG